MPRVPSYVLAILHLPNCDRWMNVIDDCGMNDEETRALLEPNFATFHLSGVVIQFERKRPLILVA